MRASLQNLITKDNVDIVLLRPTYADGWQDDPLTFCDWEQVQLQPIMIGERLDINTIVVSSSSLVTDLTSEAANLVAISAISRLKRCKAEETLDDSLEQVRLAGRLLVKEIQDGSQGLRKWNAERRGMTFEREGIKVPSQMEYLVDEIGPLVKAFLYEFAGQQCFADRANDGRPRNAAAPPCPLSKVRVTDDENLRIVYKASPELLCTHYAAAVTLA
jgi:hypothetical protein